jgi:hypothetical protein
MLSVKLLPCSPLFQDQVNKLNNQPNNLKVAVDGADGADEAVESLSVDEAEDVKIT